MPRDKERRRPLPESGARHASTKVESTTPEARSWERIDSKTGPEWGASYKGHALDLVPSDDGWTWSCTHARVCGQRRGRIGWAPDVADAERQLIALVDAFGCAEGRRVV